MLLCQGLRDIRAGQFSLEASGTRNLLDAVVVRWAVTTKNLRWKELTNFLSLHYKILGKQFAVQNPFRRGRKLHSLKPILKQISLLKSLFLSFSVCACLPETIAFSTVTKIEIEIGWHTQK